MRVLVVDDSAIVRKILTQELGRHAGIEIVGTAPDPYIARDKIIALNPDVLTLDVEMPRMDGITFLRQADEVPSDAGDCAELPDPRRRQDGPGGLRGRRRGRDVQTRRLLQRGRRLRHLVEKIKAASRARIDRAGVIWRPAPPQRLSMAETTNKIFAIGASTGGVQALTCVLSALPVNAPGTVVVQHMPAHFTTSFAQRLNGECAVQVKEAEDGDHVVPGRVLIAPGGLHMLLQRSGANYFVTLRDGPPVCHQKPSVEVLFNSVAKYAGPNAVGAILTGMGDDGATGLLNMRQAGAHTIAQDEQSCVVFGMPKEAIARDAAEKIVSLSKVAETLIGFAQD